MWDTPQRTTQSTRSHTRSRAQVTGSELHLRTLPLWTIIRSEVVE